MPKPVLTVAICTMDRPDAIAEVLSALLPQAPGVPWEVLVLDEGRSPVPASTLALLARSDASLRHVPKRPDDAPGLYGSRIACVREARGDLILFLDDDAPPGPDYLARLVALADGNPGHAGFGGVDGVGLPPSPSRLAVAYARLFGVAGKGPGRLGITGFNHSQMTWRRQTEPFATEFLHGCNMAFRKAALADLPDLSWLYGHSCCEDLVLSVVAGRSGPLLVDPGLGVSHRSVPGGRGTRADRLAATLLNHARFQAWRRPGASRAAFAWSVAGLLCKDLAIGARRRGLAAGDIVAGYARAAPAALAALSAR